MKLVIQNKRIGPILGGHPWIFSGAFKTIPDNIESGTPIEVYAEDGQYIASGYFNSYSQIAVRIWGYNQTEKIDQNFFSYRVKQAYEYRQNLIDKKKTDCFRVINGENDFLPGLIVDKYNQILTIQFHTPGIREYKDYILQALLDALTPKGIYERSELKYTGGKNKINNGTLYGDVPDLVKTKENGLKFWVDVKKGQKTGFFLDQRMKRQSLIKYCKDTLLLNCFCYTGGFSVYALAGGAKKVTSVDLSKQALELAKENVLLNKFDLNKCEFICEDVKKYLREDNIAPQNIVILDPPAFIKDRRKKEEGIAGYQGINQSGLSKTTNGGLLISCSCSQALTAQDLRFILVKAGAKTNHAIQILETFTHDFDHPSLAPYLEGDYLKVYFARITNRL